MSKGLIRTAISLDDEQKAWLDRQAALRHVSMASLIRQAVSEFRMREQRGSVASFQEVLKRTAGIWQAGDGLEEEYPHLNTVPSVSTVWSFCTTPFPSC